LFFTKHAIISSNKKFILYIDTHTEWWYNILIVRLVVQFKRGGIKNAT